MDGYVCGASTARGVLRIDPEIGEADVLYELENVDGITFSPEYKILYFNEGEQTTDGNGRVFKGTLTSGHDLVDIVERGRPLSESPKGRLDGMTTDVCGNLYIAVQNLSLTECEGSGVIRIDPDDHSEIIVCFGKVPNHRFLVLKLAAGRGIVSMSILGTTSCLRFQWEFRENPNCTFHVRGRMRNWEVCNLFRSCG